jgi:hypothetical protein
VHVIDAFVVERTCVGTTVLNDAATGVPVDFAANLLYS